VKIIERGDIFGRFYAIIRGYNNTLHKIIIPTPVIQILFYYRVEKEHFVINMIIRDSLQEFVL